MNNSYISLSAEVRELEELLELTSEENVIERMSLEARLKTVKKLLAKSPQIREMPKAHLTFRGKSVFESHGISANFGTKAARAFSEVFDAVLAGLRLNKMGGSRRIPDKRRNELLITGTAIGSFGFEFELPAEPQNLFSEQTKSEEAMNKIEMLLRLSVEGSDDDIAEIIDEIHPRSVKKAHEFMDMMIKQETWCGLEFGQQGFRFANLEQLKRSSERIQEDNIQERKENYHGAIQGVLPGGRTFEFKPVDGKNLIKGKVSQAIDEPDVLNRKWLYKEVKIKLNVMQVGQGRPRYTLISLDDLSEK